MHLLRSSSSFAQQLIYENFSIHLGVKLFIKKENIAIERAKVDEHFMNYYWNDFSVQSSPMLLRAPGVGFVRNSLLKLLRLYRNFPLEKLISNQKNASDSPSSFTKGQKPRKARIDEQQFFPRNGSTWNFPPPAKLFIVRWAFLHHRRAVYDFF